MTETYVTWRHALSVWWMLVWRGLAGTMLLGFGFSMIVGGVGSLAHFRQDVTTAITIWGVVVIGALWSVVVLRTALHKRFRRFRVALLAPY